MAPTPITQTLKDVRNQLVEPRPRFWSDEELTGIYKLGVQDLWGAILDLHADHYSVVDETHVSLPANKSQLAGVPDDCFRLLLIEPRDTTSTGDGYAVTFTPRKFNHPDFSAARTQSASDVSSVGEVYYHVTGVGSPIAAPVVLTAPKLSANLLLRIQYCQMIDVTDSNPIPGGSDNALKAWTIAYARAKETEDRTPDAGWLQVYATEKQLILTRLTPRQEQEPEVVENFIIGAGI